MYIYDICNGTYHWACLKNTGCYTVRQREEVNKNDNWACPACADLTAEQKHKRNYESYDKELIRISINTFWILRHVRMNPPPLCHHLIILRAS